MYPGHRNGHAAGRRTAAREIVDGSRDRRIDPFGEALSWAVPLAGWMLRAKP